MFEVVAAVGDDGAVVADRKDDIHGLVIADDVGAGDEEAAGAVEEPSGSFAGVGGMHPGDAAERAAVDLGAEKRAAFGRCSEDPAQTAPISSSSSGKPRSQADFMEEAPDVDSGAFHHRVTENTENKCTLVFSLRSL